MLDDVRNLNGKRFSFMRQLVAMLDRIADDFDGPDPLHIVHDADAIIRGAIMADPHGGPALLVEGADGVARVREFPCLEDAVVALEGEGLRVHDPYSATVPRFSVLPL